MLPGDRGDVDDLAGELALVRGPDEVNEHPDGDGLPGRGDSRPRGDLAGVQDDGAEDSLRPDHDGYRMPVLIREGFEERGVEGPCPVLSVPPLGFGLGRG